MPVGVQLSLFAFHPNKMNCTRCGHISNLTQSWSLDGTVKRYRKCPKCDHKFFTYEIPEESLTTATSFVDAFFND